MIRRHTSTAVEQINQTANLSVVYTPAQDRLQAYIRSEYFCRMCSATIAM
jgi:formamidopyrimidine-DNA glycosylase